MKKLYVTDLDCTLMNQKQELTENSVEALNSAIDNGVSLLVATGRGKSAISKVKDLNLTLPIIMLNGSIIYNTKDNKFERIKSIPVEEALDYVKSTYNTGDDSILFHTLDNGEIQEYMLTECAEKIKQLRTKNHKTIKFVSIKNIESFIVNHKILFMQYKSSEDRIQATKRFLFGVKCQNMYNSNILYHRDEYCKDIAFLDIYPVGADKSDAVAYIKEVYGFDYITAFGDSNNDLSFRTIADRLIVVSNGVAELKNRADLIIGSCNEDAVAKFILKENSNDN